MTNAETTDGGQVVPPRRWPWWSRLILIIIGGTFALAAAGLMMLDTSIGHRWIVEQVAALKPANGLRYHIGRIKGSIYSRAILVDVRISDPKGVVFSAPLADLSWSPLAWVSNRLDITTLLIPSATLVKLPQTNATQRRGPILPGFDIHVGALRIDRLRVGQAVLGKARSGRVQGRADIRHGRALIDLNALIQGSDQVHLMLDSAPDADRFDIDLKANGAADGLIAKLSGLKRPVRATVQGDGRWRTWRGTAMVDAGTARIADLAITNRSGRYTLTGTVTPSAVTTGKIARLGMPHVTVNGAATLANRLLDGQLVLRTPELLVDTSGAVDLARSSYRNVRVRARLLKPPALFPNMTGRNIELRVILDGAFATAAFDYRLDADRLAFDKTGFEGAHAAGRGRLTKLPITVPLRLSVARVTGVGDVAGGILRNFALNGVLRIDGKQVSGDKLAFRSDKLNGTLTLVLDLGTGTYQVGLTGTLARYLIPGLGIVDVASMLRVVPGAGGKGTRIVGSGTAQVVRLDNEFFRSLAGGLPHLTTGLERTGDGILHFTNLVLTAPSIRIAGTGYRRRDGSFFFDGAGRQKLYGALVLKLDGHINRPTIDLALARPNEALGLKDVHAHLDPNPSGYDFVASGGSLLGAFAGNGQLLLPKGDHATVNIAALDVSGIKAHGVLQAVSGGFDGTVALEQGGATGTLAFQPVNGVQRIEGHVTADGATLAGDLRLRRGTINMVALLDPEGVSIDGDFRFGGIRKGRLSLSRLMGTARLRGGTGQITATLTGARGRAFDIKTVTDVTPDRYSITASGTIDRREARLAEPAIITRDGDGWQLAKTRLLFAGGQADLSGRFTSRSAAIDASMTRVPLSLIDLAYPDLGLDGVASGKLSFTDGGGLPPTGKVDVTIRGLSRAGLVLTSKPIDVGLAGVLLPGSAAIRAVMASEGKTIGRAQARIAPLGSGTLMARLANSPLFAQLRYDGPADTLWRLTGLESFDLSGPVAIGADIGGHLNDPRIRGALRANGARIESATTGTVLTNVQAAGQFAGSKLVISSFGSDAGKGGRVTGTGTFDFAAVNGFGLDLVARADNAVLINRDDIAATVTGPLTIKSDGSGGVVAGNVVLNRSRYRLGQAASAAALPRLNVREINLPGDDEDERIAAKPWRLDVTAKASAGVAVTGLGLTSEWSADLRIVGEPTNPAISGRADLVRGTYEFAGRDFALERGAIRFGGEAPVNPSLDILANADSQGLSAAIRVNGQALRPQISFTSTPALPEDELLSRLLFGTSITNLSAPEALQLASAVAALQNGGNGLNPINAVRRAVGLDRLRILPADKAVGRTTSVAAGKYITRRVYAEIITDGQGYSATQVEFQVTRWLSLLSTVSTLGRTSVNVRVSKDY